MYSSVLLARDAFLLFRRAGDFDSLRVFDVHEFRDCSSSEMAFLERVARLATQRFLGKGKVDLTANYEQWVNLPIPDDGDSDLEEVVAIYLQKWLFTY